MKPGLLAISLTAAILAIAIWHRHDAHFGAKGGLLGGEPAPAASAPPVSEADRMEAIEKARKAALEALPGLLKDGGWPGESGGAADTVLRALPTGAEPEFKDLLAVLAIPHGTKPAASFEALAAVDEFQLFSSVSSAPPALSADAAQSLSSAMTQWAASDSQAAEQWLAAAPAGPVRDTAVAAFVAQTAAGHTAEDRDRLIARLKKETGE